MKTTIMKDEQRKQVRSKQWSKSSVVFVSSLNSLIITWKRRSNTCVWSDVETPGTALFRNWYVSICFPTERNQIHTSCMHSYMRLNKKKNFRKSCMMCLVLRLLFRLFLARYDVIDHYHHHGLVVLMIIVEISAISHDDNNNNTNDDPFLLISQI